MPRQPHEVSDVERQEMRYDIHVTDRNKPCVMHSFSNDRKGADDRLPGRIDVGRFLKKCETRFQSGSLLLRFRR